MKKQLFLIIVLCLLLSTMVSAKKGGIEVSVLDNTLQKSCSKNAELCYTTYLVEAVDNNFLLHNDYVKTFFYDNNFNDYFGLNNVLVLSNETGNWTPIDNSKNYLVHKGESFVINVSGQKSDFVSVDNVLFFNVNNEWYNFSEYAWWNTTFNNCANITLDISQQDELLNINLSVPDKSVNDSDIRIINGSCTNNNIVNVPFAIVGNSTQSSDVVFWNYDNSTTYSVFWNSSITVDKDYLDELVYYYEDFDGAEFDAANSFSNWYRIGTTVGSGAFNGTIANGNYSQGFKIQQINDGDGEYCLNLSTNFSVNGLITSFSHTQIESDNSYSNIVNLLNMSWDGWNNPGTTIYPDFTLFAESNNFYTDSDVLPKKEFSKKPTLNSGEYTQFKFFDFSSNDTGAGGIVYNMTWVNYSQDNSFGNYSEISSATGGGDFGYFCLRRPTAGTNIDVIDNLFLGTYENHTLYYTKTILTQQGTQNIESPNIISLEIQPSVAFRNDSLNVSFNISNDVLINLSISWYNGSIKVNESFQDYTNITANELTNNFNGSIPVDWVEEAQNWTAEITTCNVDLEYCIGRNTSVLVQNVSPALTIDFLEYSNENLSINMTYTSLNFYNSGNCSFYVNDTFEQSTSGLFTLDTFLWNKSFSQSEDVGFNVTCYDETTNYNDTGINLFYYDILSPLISWSYPLNNYTAIINTTLDVEVNASDSRLGSINLSVFNSTDDLVDSFFDENETGLIMNITRTYTFPVEANYSINASAIDRLNSTTNNTVFETFWYEHIDIPTVFNDSSSSTSVTSGNSIDFWVYATDEISGVSSVSINIIDSNNENITGSPFSMALEGDNRWIKSYATSSTGTFNVSNFTITDNVGNTNFSDSTLYFTVTTAGGSGGGGGGGGTVVVKGDVNETFVFTTDTLSNNLDLFMTPNSKRFKTLLVKNTGTKEQVYVMKCEGTICNYLSTINEFNLNVSEERELNINISLPRTVIAKQRFNGKLLLDNNFYNEESIEVSVSVEPIAGLVLKYLDVIGRNTDVTNKLMINKFVPDVMSVFVPNWLIIFLFEGLWFVLTFLFEQSPFRDWVRWSGVFGIFVLLLVLLV